MATEITLHDVERYHLLRANQAGYMAAAIYEFEFFKDVFLDESDASQVYLLLFLWAEARAEANEISTKKEFLKPMLQSAGIFGND